MTSTTQNNAEQFNPRIESSFNQMRTLDDILKNVPKSAHPTVMIFWNTNIKQERRIEGLNSQVAEKSREIAKLQEAKSYEYTERKRTEDLNNVLCRQLRDFYNLTVGVSLALGLSDVFVDSGYKFCPLLGQCLRGLGISAVIVCALYSRYSLQRNKEQINAISQEGKSDN